MATRLRPTSRASSAPTREARHRASSSRWRSSLLAGLAALALHAESGYASNPTPLITSPTPEPSRLATSSPAMPSAAATPSLSVTTASPSEPARATPTSVTTGGPEPVPPVEELGAAPVATAGAPRPRAYRTPERAAPPVFIAPEPEPPAAENEPSQETPLAAEPPPRATAAVVIFRATARTALQAFDLRVTYPHALGTFATNAQGADCSGGTGALVVANNVAAGQLKLVVASGQPLPFPLDIFCRFALAPGAGLDPGAFGVQVAEVTSDNKVGDPSLLIINVVVR